MVPKANVEPVREEEDVAWRQVPIVAVQGRLARIRSQEDHHVRPRRRLGRRRHHKPCSQCALTRRPSGRQADAHVHAAVAKVQCVRVSLRPVADNGHAARADQRRVGIGVVIKRRHCQFSMRPRLTPSTAVIHRLTKVRAQVGRFVSGGAAGHGQPSGSGHFNHTEWPQHVDEAVHLLSVPVISTITESVATSTTRARKTVASWTIWLRESQWPRPSPAPGPGTQTAAS